MGQVFTIESQLSHQQDDYHEWDNIGQKEDLSLTENKRFTQANGRNRIDQLLDTINLQHIKHESLKPMKSIIEQFSDVFYLKGDHLTITNAAEHEIETTTNIPINKRQYRFPESTKRQINEEIEKMERQGVIQPSKSPWNAPVLCIP